MKLSARILAVALVLILAVGAVSAQANWKPNKPITIIVPWGAGGSTDQVTRVRSEEHTSELQSH